MEQEIFNVSHPFEHGGNIYRLAEELKMQERKVIDFSASINPLGISKKVKVEIRKHLKHLHNYPDPEAKRLRKWLAQYHGIEQDMILCGSGSTELIYLIARTLMPRRVLIPAPTFSEYERAIALQNITPLHHPLPQGEEDSLGIPASLTGGNSLKIPTLLTEEGKSSEIPSPLRGEGKGGGVIPGFSHSNRIDIRHLMLNKEKGFEINPDEFIKTMEGKLPTPPLPPFSKGRQGGINNSPLITYNSSLSFDVAFLCNPNNPTGRLLVKHDVKRIADAAKELKCYLVVDEAFIDFCPDESVIKDVGNNPYLIVLRTMSNFYAIPGLRIGYGVFPVHLINFMKGLKEPWTVNNLAQRAAVIALKDRVFKKETTKLIAEEKRFLEKNFRKNGIEFFNSAANFYLLRMDNAREIRNYLMKKGILVRECSNFKGLDSTYLRISVKSHRENTILIKELASLLKRQG
ncbi:MAG: aminotransferase class I/II-fold pyridoxal phosphate-dependent enzyme [Nitrospirae bacterium]|nr:aminotransferase class I/II-fold pyridoxal phosphate-dependent enzyme [Nitrospirota bacterium]